MDWLAVLASVTCFCFFNGWDVMGAGWVSNLLDQRNLPFEMIGHRPSFHGSDLSVVIDVINQSRDAG
jgi:hypothetical protein